MDQQTRESLRELTTKYLKNQVDKETYRKEKSKLLANLTSAEKLLFNDDLWTLGIFVAGFLVLFGGCFAYMSQLANPRSPSLEEKIEAISRDKCLMYKVDCPK